jgi:hypothetical protein
LDSALLKCAQASTVAGVPIADDGRPGKGIDKGKVEALVKYSRANFLTPVPQ